MHVVNAEFNGSGRARIATWNLERCPSSRAMLADAQQRRLELVAADVWVLTETFLDRSPGDGFVGVFSPPHPVRRSGPDERYVGVWSRWPIELLDVPFAHRRGTVAVMVEAPLGPLIVYGCVIAYGGERTFNDGSPARPWEVHAAEVERQTAEWRHLRTLHPGVPLVVAGDFNQARSGRRRSYGTNATRAALTAGLAAAGLRSLTDVDLVATGAIGERSHVEHICASDELEPVSEVLAWDRVDEDGRRLSDHPTIAVDLALANTRSVAHARSVAES